MNTIYQKYLAALLQFAVVLVGAVQVLLPGGIQADEAWQLVAIAAGAVATFFLPLVNGPWSGLLKTGAGLLATIATAIIPFVVPGGHFDGAALVVVVLAGLNALASQIGVSVRLDAAKADRETAIVADGGRAQAAMSLDPAAASIVNGIHATSV